MSNKAYVVVRFDEEIEQWVNEIVFLDIDLAVKYAEDFYEAAYVQVLDVVF